jgi:hypothetical protein
LRRISLDRLRQYLGGGRLTALPFVLVHEAVGLVGAANGARNHMIAL